MKIIKILLTILGIVAVLNIIIVVIFLTTFDANQYKDELSTAAKEETGRELNFNGDVSLTLYPSLGMKLGSMTLQNAPGFGTAPMLEVQNASVSVDVMSLLSMQPKIDQLVLTGLTLRLQKNKQGKTNWDDLMKSGSDETVNVPVDRAGKPESSAAAGFKLAGSFGGLDIRNVKLLWQDDSSGENYDLDIKKLTTGRIEENKTFSVQLVLSVQSTDKLEATLDLQASALIKAQTIKLSSLKLVSQASGSLIPVDSMKMELMADINYELASQQIGISGFHTKLQTEGGVLLSSLAQISGEIGFDLKRQQLTLASLDISAELAGDSIPGKKLQAGLSSRQLDFDLNRRSVDLQELNITLNENRFRGFVKVADYATPDVRFVLESESFDVDELLGKTEQPDSEQPVEENKPEDIEIKLPMDVLRTLRLDGKLSIASLKVQGLKLNEVMVKLDAAKGIVAINPISVNLYDGSFVGKVRLNAQGRQPAYRIEQTLSGFQIGEFLQDFMQDDMISGKANVDIKLTSNGEWLSELKKNLNGNIALAVLDGSLKGLNLRQKIKMAQARLKREKTPDYQPEVTDFSSLKLSARITDGVLTTEDLDMQAPLMRVGGKGSVNLVEETLNYLVNAKLVATTKGQQGGSADDLAGLNIPVLIKGSWLSPEFDVQLDEIFKARLDAKKAQIRDSVAQQKAQVQQQLNEQKQKLKTAQEKQLAAKKQQLKKQQELAAAEEKARLKAIEDKKRAELAAKKKQQEEEAKEKLKDKLKKLF